MKIIVGIVVIIIVILIWIFLKSPTTPSKKEIQIKVPDDKILSEIRPEFLKEYENVRIDDEDSKETDEGNEELWNEWIKSGLVPGSNLTVDFYFYTPNEASAIKLKMKLEQEGFNVSVYPETTFVILKGWKIKTQIRRTWDLETLNHYSRFMAKLGQKEGPYLEGFAAMIK